MSGKKRSWFQLHLSTCLVLMLVAALLLGANLIERRRDVVSFGARAIHAVTGWPYAWRVRKTECFFFTNDWLNRPGSASNPVTETLQMRQERKLWDAAAAGEQIDGWYDQDYLPCSESAANPMTTSRHVQTQYQPRSITINLVLAGGVFINIAIACEWWVRRRSTGTNPTTN